MELFSHQNVPWEWRKADRMPETESQQGEGDATRQEEIRRIELGLAVLLCSLLWQLSWLFID